MASLVPHPVTADQICYVGVDNVLAHERAFMDEHGLKTIPSAQAMQGSAAVLDWIRASQLTHVYVHLDLDVLDPVFFRSLLFANPDVPNPIESEHGKLRLAHVQQILRDVEQAVTVTGMTFAEYMPWDCLNLKKMLASLECLR